MVKLTTGVSAAALVLVLTGCAGMSGEAGGPPSSSGTATTAAGVPDRQAVLDALGAPPASGPPDPARLAELRQEATDQRWAQVTQQFPDAVRPEVALVHEIEGGDLDPLTACLREAGLPVVDDVGRGEDGSTSQGYSFEMPDGGPLREQAELASYRCDVMYPGPVTETLTVEQAAWLFDYLTMFQLPCLEALGAPSTEPGMTREEFASTWPHQGWYPSAGSESSRGLTDAEVDRVDKACPAPDSNTFG
ncbi:hypothetical protein [Frigoribacterium sp. VKM Ac-2836]|uniref:hypothetical protein n=1 Tax=Frigoribacterium sp. VKM Ac-2836 TaxID=2739014 RepID=UPI0015646A72|nr:hypothetical protein [Frigoribacterium sp. VKM Ac-2836]NRD26350.1 hypothetical protein [Frigoribacterium sp. VKM Ac-2836]